MNIGRQNVAAAKNDGVTIGTTGKQKVAAPVMVKEAALAQPIKAHKPKAKKQVRPTWVEKITPPPPVIHTSPIPKIAEKKQEKLTHPVQVSVPREVKVRAGKFVHSMETSDAYRQYKKDGSKSKISEFDFRSMLFCTMESSPQTLTRNMNLFKEYAGIHNRKDLIAFLDYCEEHFSPILKPQTKQHELKIGRLKKQVL